LNTSRRERKRTSRREESVSSPNETAKYLYDVKHNRFIEWQERIAKYALRKRLAYNEHDADDLASSFMVWLVKKDKFQGRTSDPIMYHWVRGQMFVQWVSRLREKQGKDGLSRHRDKKNRTQQEKKVGEFKITSPNYASTAISSTDESGRVSSEDWYYDSDTDPTSEELEKKDIDSHICEAFASVANEEADVETLYNVMQEMMDKSYRSDLEWADAWSVSKQKVKYLKSIVRDSLRSNRALREIVSLSI
jgi:hypothetical protein